MSSTSRSRTSITAAPRPRARRPMESASASIAPSWMSSIGWRSVKRSITPSTSCRPTLMLGSPNTTTTAPIRAAGASARPRCRPFLTRYHWQRRNSWRHNHRRQPIGSYSQHRLSDQVSVNTDQPALRTHPTRRPREDIFLPKQNALISLTAVFPAFSAAGSGNCGNRGAVLTPTELATVDPHPVQNHSQTPGDRDDRSTHPASLSHSHAPCLQPRPFPAASKQCMCRLVEHRAQQGIATFGHPAFIVGLARLVALRRQADMRADRPGTDEALRLVDRRAVGQRYHCADPWGGHQPPAHRIAADRVEQHLVQNGQLLAHDLADTEQRLDDRSQPRKSCDELADPRVVSKAADNAHFQTEIAQSAAQIGFYVQQLALKELAAGQQHPLFLGNQRLHMHRLEQADPHHLCDPACIVAVRLADLLRRQQSLHVPCLYADHWQVGRHQPIDQPLRQRASLDPDPAKGHTERGQNSDDLGRLGRYFLLQDHLAGIVDHAHRCCLYRYVQTSEINHLIAPSSGSRSPDLNPLSSEKRGRALI